MRVMSTREGFARRLDTLRLLSGGSRGAQPRQQSVTATIDWSYRLLAEPERSLFARLSVFAGGFDLDAAHGVCGEDDADEHDTLDLLTGLVDKSMVTMRSDGGGTRYGVLETLRAYGRERLCDNGVDDEYARRHTAYFAELAQRAAAGMHGPDEQAWVERMLPDYDNLRTAFEHAIGDNDLDLALRLVTSLSEYVHLRIGFEASGWANACWRSLILSVRCAPPRSVSQRGAHGTAAIKRGRASWPPSQAAVFPAAATAGGATGASGATALAPALLDALDFAAASAAAPLVLGADDVLVALGAAAGVADVGAIADTVSIPGQRGA